MSARTYQGGVPAPPPHIKTEMFEAGRTDDSARLDRAHAAYVTWLNNLGYYTPQGTTRPDGAIR